MQFTNPAALWLLPLIVVPLLLMKRREPATRHVVSALYLWRSAIERDAGRLSLERVRRSWIVALQMMCIAAIIVTLSGPVAMIAGGLTVLVFDVSASMAARQDGSSRIELAHAQAKTIVTGLPSSSHVRLIAAGASARDLGDYVAADPRLTAAIDAIDATAGTTDLSAALTLVMGRGDATRIVVLTDSTRNDKDDSPAVQWVHLGTPADNAAVARVAARPNSLGDPGGQVLAVVKNYGTHVREADVEITVDERPAYRTHLALPPESTRALTVAVPTLGRVITARIPGGDALAVDDTRSTFVPTNRIRVSLLGLKGSFVERALRAHPLVALQSETASAIDVVVCENCEQAYSDIPTLSVTSVDKQASRGVVTLANATHPLASWLDVGEQTASVTPASVDASADVILRAGGRPALTASDRNGHPVVAVHLDLSQPDFSLSPAFPVLIANTLDWLTLQRAVPRELTAGEPLTITVPSASSTAIRVIGPEGRDRKVDAAGPRFLVSDTRAAGEYRVILNGVEQSVMVQPAVDGESDLATVVDAQSDRRETTSFTAVNEPLAFGRWLAVIAMVLVALEWRLRGARRDRLPWCVATIVLLVLAASGLTIPIGYSPMTVMVALDRSASMPAGSQQQAVARVNAMAATMKSGDRLGVIAFGANAALEQRPSTDAHLTRVRSAVTSTSTDIASALRLASAVVPQDGPRRIILASDGRDTSGGAEREASLAAQKGLSIDIVPPADGNHDRLRVTRVVAPSDAAAGEPYAVSIEVSGSAGQRGRVALYRDDDLIARPDITINADGTGSATISERQDTSRPFVYRAEMESDDESITSAGAVVVIEGAPAVLYVSSSRATLDADLAGAGLRLTHVAPEAVPTTAKALSTFAAVVLDDVPAEQLRPESAEALSSYVEREGGGLLLLGSSRTLTLSGYPATALERILPIDLRPRAGQTAPSVELVIVFDKSGSMADVIDSVSKIEVARQTVLRVFELMPPGDRIGVLAFDSTPTTVVPLAAVRDGAALRAALERVSPSGSTSIASTLETAIGWLLAPGRPPVARRQILLISDGRTSAADADRLRSLSRTPGVQLSVFAVGPNADRPLLEEMAAASGGRAYFPADLRELPRAVAREATRSSGGGVVSERFLPQIAAHPALAGIDAASVPALGGYVVSSVKPTAMSILRSHLDDPVLAAWRSGLGRVAVFTADLGSPGSTAFRQWRDEARLWRQTLRWLNRTNADPAIQLTLRDSGAGPQIEVDARSSRGGFLDLDDAAAIVRTPSEADQRIALEATAPGHFEAPIPVTTTGPYTVDVTARERSSNVEHRVVRALYWSADRERERGTDLPFLTRLATLTGGRVLAENESPFDAARPMATRDLLPWAAAIALALFLIDLTTVGRLVPRRLRQWRHRHGSAGQNRVAA